MRIKLRPAQSSDYPFIFATYIRNRWFDKTNKTTLKRSTWSSMQHKRLEAVLESTGALIACLDEDEDTILGYSLKDGKSTFVYVKLAFRAPAFDLANRLTKEIK